ncbi:hypothetical protein J7E29_16530 [Streptomyces sp. ISL-90]|nr:hypothetical protein [Streptomyces sp. ISL-90]
MTFTQRGLVRFLKGMGALVTVSDTKIPNPRGGIVKALRVEAEPIGYRVDWYVSQRLWFGVETAAPYVFGSPIKEPRFVAWNIRASDSVQKLGLAVAADLQTMASEFHKTNDPDFGPSVAYIIGAGRLINAVTTGQTPVPADALSYAQSLGALFKAEGRYRPLPAAQ